MGNCWYDFELPPQLLGDLGRPGLSEASPDVLTDVRAFPRRYWDADFVALAILPEFARLRWEKEIEVDPPPEVDSEETRNEIAQLLSLMAQRAGALPEITAQSTGFPLYWLGLLMMNRTSHPSTYALLKVASRVGEMLMSYYKLKFNRPRPHQLCPALMPPLIAPGHASYPSGHALLSHLLSRTGAEVRPEAERALMALAERVARNREIAGLHYPSDTRASEKIAGSAFRLLQRCRGFQRLRDEARTEWTAQRASGRRRGG